MFNGEQVYESIPVVALRGLVVLPGELLHFDAGREKSVAALNKAMESGGLVFLSAQRDARKSDIGPEDIHEIGTLCTLRQVLTMSGNSVRVFAEGKERAVAVSITEGEHYFEADIACLSDGEVSNVELEALRRRLDKLFHEYASLSSRINSDVMISVESRETTGEYADAIANAALPKAEQRQAILEVRDPAQRMRLVLGYLADEIEILKADKRIARKVQKQVDQNQKEYYLREQIKAIRSELGETSQSEADLWRQQMAKKSLPENIREKLSKEIDRYADLPAGSHEQPPARNYIECVLALPWVEQSEDNLDLAHAREILERDHYGLAKVKQRIVEYIAVGKLTGKINGQILCFVGPPGVGKTSIAASIAEALNRKFVRMSLGGIRDEAEIRGHRRTYIGAMPGRIIAAMRQAGEVNPVILFDEIDKLASDYRGDPAAAMLEVLDGAQNFAFRDHFLELPYDLSKVMFLTTANDKSAIPQPLLDRMEVIEVPSYLETEKMQIAKRHLLPKQMEKHGLKKSMLTVPDDMFLPLIRGYTAEAGVRELERVLGAVCRKAACEIGDGKAKVRLTHARMVEYLGQPHRPEEKRRKEDLVGVANGLAWTSVGGEMLEIEVQVVPGVGQVQLTGKLGDVMQESAKAALTFVRANAHLLGIAEDRFKNFDIHLHVPEGAVPKDGPSAGITMATAVASALTEIPVHAGVCMTGEISLRGRVLPIGGLREKLLAAVRGGMKIAVVPEANRKDMEEVPEEVKSALQIIYVSDALSALKAALLYMPNAKKNLPLSDTKRSAAGAIQ